MLLKTIEGQHNILYNDSTAVNTADRQNLPADLQSTFPADLWEPIAIEVVYAGHIDRMRVTAERIQRQEDKRIPADIDYDKIGGLRIEAQQKLKKIRPLSIGQAMRISGVNPADISVLLIRLAEVKHEQN